MLAVWHRLIRSLAERAGAPPEAFKGEGYGRFDRAMHDAVSDAWERAKAHGKQRGPLRVAATYVGGEGQVGWSRVILVDDKAQAT